MNFPTFPNEIIENEEANVMNTITLTLEQYNELLKKATYFDVLKATKIKGNKVLLDDLEIALFSEGSEKE